MAQVIADSNGNILRFTTTYLEDDFHTDMPVSDFPNRVWFDEVTNAALIEDISNSLNSYTVSNGVLKKDGLTIAVAAPGQDALDRLTLVLSVMPKLASGNADPLTSDELKAVIRLGLNRVK